MEEESFLDSEILALTEKKRPTAITVLSILGYVSAAAAVGISLSNIPARIGPWYSSFLIISAIVRVICSAGFWKMKKWSVYLYICFSIMAQWFLLTIGHWQIGILITPAVTTAILLNFFKKMN